MGKETLRQKAWIWLFRKAMKTLLWQGFGPDWMKSEIDTENNKVQRLNHSQRRVRSE